jgi:hypothetical protein
MAQAVSREARKLCKHGEASQLPRQCLRMVRPAGLPGEDMVALDVVLSLQAFGGLPLALSFQDEHQLVVEVDSSNRVTALVGGHHDLVAQVDENSTTLTSRALRSTLGHRSDTNSPIRSPALSRKGQIGYVRSVSMKPRKTRASSGVHDRGIVRARRGRGVAINGFDDINPEASASLTAPAKGARARRMLSKSGQSRERSTDQ